MAHGCMGNVGDEIWISKKHPQQYTAVCLIKRFFIAWHVACQILTHDICFSKLTSPHSPLHESSEAPGYRGSIPSYSPDAHPRCDLLIFKFISCQQIYYAFASVWLIYQACTCCVDSVNRHPWTSWFCTLKVTNSDNWMSQLSWWLFFNACWVTALSKTNGWWAIMFDGFDKRWIDMLVFTAGHGVATQHRSCWFWIQQFEVNKIIFRNPNTKTHRRVTFYPY